jgi:hypothetical protein
MQLSSAVVTATLILATGVAPATPDGSNLLAAIDARNAALPSYTFHADVAVRMHHFPWLRFHLLGDGRYDKGERYLVHFTKMPWFATQVHDIDLSMLDPSLWPKNYTYDVCGNDGANIVFELHAIHDPTLTDAKVALNEEGAVWVDATYADGMHIRMTVAPQIIGGYELPSQLAVDLDYPHMPLSADAGFSNYQFSSIAAR